MSNEILYILLPDYAAHEAVYLSQAIASDEYAMNEAPLQMAPTILPFSIARFTIGTTCSATGVAHPKPPMSTKAA